MTSEDWADYNATIAEPNRRPDRPFGAYATNTRKKRHDTERQMEASAAASQAGL
jgi:hypothetical protein